jgi:hypothetical protein
MLYFSFLSKSLGPKYLCPSMTDNFCFKTTPEHISSCCSSALLLNFRYLKSFWVSRLVGTFLSERQLLMLFLCLFELFLPDLLPSTMERSPGVSSKLLILRLCSLLGRIYSRDMEFLACTFLPWRILCSGSSLALMKKLSCDFRFLSSLESPFS